jgi:hypothetical protein
MMMDREALKSLASRVVDQDSIRSLAERAGLVAAPSSAGRDLVLLAAGLGLGALFMYLLDPDQGQRRRKQVTNLASDAEKTIGDTARNLSERAREVVGKTAEQMRPKTRSA